MIRSIQIPEISVSQRFLEIAHSFNQVVESGYPAAVERAANCIADAFQNGKKLLIFGNGGSASDAQHLCGELVVRFQRNRRALPAIALCSDSVALTACGNDYAFKDVFARQIEALGQPGDIALGISTSGNSANVVEALRMARKLGLVTMLLTGLRAGPACLESDIVLAAPGRNTARTQEVHLVSYHCMCEIIEARLFGEVAE
jgi:D-sedoheptulose 7-phosphate isomerase